MSYHDYELDFHLGRSLFQSFCVCYFLLIKQFFLLFSSNFKIKANKENTFFVYIFVAVKLEINKIT